MINVIIDGKKLQAEEGKTILEVAMQAGIKIPTLCYHKELAPYGGCRVCLIEIVNGGRLGLEASCLYKISEGLEVKTDTPRVKTARKIVLELLLSLAPDSEKITKLATEYGITKTRAKRDSKTECILCGLCVRVCAEVVKRHAITFAHRGSKRNVKTSFDKTAETCIGCGACAYLCPTKVIKIEQIT